MFAIDTIDRFIVMCTFSDGNQPLAEQTIKAAGFKVDKFLKFNNSAIFEKSPVGQIDKTIKMYFSLGYSNFNEFV